MIISPTIHELLSKIIIHFEENLNTMLYVSMGIKFLVGLYLLNTPYYHFYHILFPPSQLYYQNSLSFRVIGYFIYFLSLCGSSSSLKVLLYDFFLGLWLACDQ